MDKVVELVRHDVIAVVTINNPPVNALSAAARRGILESLNVAIAAPEVRAIVLTCGGRTFVAGADITEFGKPPQSPGLNELLAAVENSPKPIVAAIHGNALGGGLELALVCHFRVAVEDAKFGFPEVKLGILPGAGGTQRLPRAVGPELAVKMIAGGEPISAAEALKGGLIDEIVQGPASGAEAFARKVLAEKRPLRKLRDDDSKLASARADRSIFTNAVAAMTKKSRGLQAPFAAAHAVSYAIDLPFDEGLKREGDDCMKLLVGDQSKAQRYAFFAERTAQKIPDVPAEIPLRPVKKVGILGAGTMGGGIAMNFASAGIPVTIVEIKQEALDRGLQVIKSNYDRTAARGKLTPEQVDQRMGLLTGSLDMNDFRSCDLVIEAVFERMDVKKGVFEKLDIICKPGAILATNTSALNIDDIASVTKRPQDVIGLHFFSPANIMKLLEVIRAEHTAKDVIATSMKLAKQIGKVPVLAGVCPGFIGNRMLSKRERQANEMVLEGAMLSEVDRALYDFGFPMGPFQMNDLAGLDIGWVKEESRSSTLIELLCEVGRFGQKTGAGYYDYDDKRSPKPSPVTEKLIDELIGKSGKKKRQISNDEVLERCIYSMINEGAKILEEGKAIRASDIDVVWVNGYGWPVYRGGPMYYADQIGLANVLAKIKEFHVSLGDDFKPAALLEKLVAHGKKFADFEQSPR
ncbi:3-hydroxyacyl-CoA dehydrogenase NAD-binding domain-containing protein [Bradyrhizobium huanghuaihaiense]|uniref:3-hydroxyacyl-CoA dehydrogenase NAD-binding domain-containing protein n=1 Tax=Bradyrhizobium huanghuaihaiense TaxID=990078 RepID=UPI0021AA4B6F|nr:3-hydroxyacyl-CoA dehydrogenase NAD-binding domain-containing protein [Bradyrhizobium sp. CB3035]UWU75838.1 3-hydroxyacyl-CoA dehydrogenase NAD-binding domain-containing protein [Bradyrhizobium sp. CB3035]